MVAGGILFIGVLSGELIPGIQTNPFYWDIRSRFSMFRNAFDLAGDFFLMGGGLASFPGNYSNYILGIFDYFIGYSHNLYLDIIIEQGVIGLITFVGILLIGLWQVMTHQFKPNRQFDYLDYLNGGVLVGLLTMMMQGMLENSLYGMRGTPLIFLLPALAFATTKGNRSIHLLDHITADGKGRRKKLLLYRLGVIVAIGLLVVFYRPLVAKWYANLGSVEQARVELQDWPDSRPDSRIYQDGSFDLAVQFFQKALDFDADNRTANFRLGYIALEQRDFPTAVEYFERAHAQDQHHRGIQKKMGYSYVFTGEIDTAHQILSGIEEAKNEMTLYNWWWGTQEREDLASYALQFVESAP
jgi:tetratricopeptide (TPR) repeat protein